MTCILLDKPDVIRQSLNYCQGVEVNLRKPEIMGMEDLLRKKGWIVTVSIVRILNTK
jgi:hypothetical protein